MENVVSSRTSGSRTDTDRQTNTLLAMLRSRIWAEQFVARR